MSELTSHNGSLLNASENQSWKCTSNQEWTKSRGIILKDAEAQDVVLHTLQLLPTNPSSTRRRRTYLLGHLQA